MRGPLTIKSIINLYYTELIIREESISMADQILSREEIDALITAMCGSDRDCEIESSSKTAVAAYDCIPRHKNEPAKSLHGAELTQPHSSGQGGYPIISYSSDIILDSPLEISVVLRETLMRVSDLINLGQGSFIEFNRFAGAALEVFANEQLIARGEVIAVDKKHGIRITEIVTSIEPIKKLP